MAKSTVENLDNGQLGLMWNFLKMGSGKPNIPVLKEHLDALRQLLIQKTGGEQSCSKAFEIPFEDADTIINCIVIETMQIYLSGGLDKLENSSDAAPVKRGFWKPISESEMTGFNPKFAGRDPIAGYKCFNCGNEAIFSCNDEFVLSDYCPNCGAKMDGGDENAN